MFMKRNEFKRNYNFVQFDIVNSNVYKPSPIDSLPPSTVVDSDGNTLIVLENDIALLFNQERLDNLGPDNIKKFFDNLASQSMSVSSLRSKCSDADLVRLCKSRYLQTPSEILAWSNYLNDNYEQLVDEVREHVKNVTSDSKNVTSDSKNVTSDNNSIVSQ